MAERHTPGPWHFHLNKSGTAWILRDARKRVLGSCSWHSNGAEFPTRSESEANAARIVLCCNAHDELLDIAETIELGLKRGYTPAELLDENSPIRDRIRAAIARAALTKAAPEQQEQSK